MLMAKSTSAAKRKALALVFWVTTCASYHVAPYGQSFEVQPRKCCKPFGIPCRKESLRRERRPCHSVSDCFYMRFSFPFYLLFNRMHYFAEVNLNFFVKRASRGFARS